jgi:tetratricopeptide (TPR) repeat protein
LRPEDPRVVSALAYARIGLGDTAAASALFDTLTQAESPEWQARGFRAMARLHWRAGRAEKAEAALWRALGLDARSPAARADVLFLAQISLTRDTWTPVEALLDSLVASRPREAEAHYWLGRMALKRQQDGVALDRFRRACALAPKRPDFAEALASAYYAREECGPALAALAPVRARLGSEGLAVYGHCLQQQGRAQAAVSEFARLNAAKPGADNLAAYARALTAAKRAREAVASIQASPYAGEPAPRKALAEADLALGQAGQARQALAGLDAPQDPELHFLLGQAAYALREYPQAADELTAALRYREDYPDAKYLHGLCLLKQGRSGEAHHYFQELMDDGKAAWRAKGSLGQGQAFAKEDKPEAAEANLRRSFQAVPGAEAAAHLALVLLKENRNAEAGEWAAKARKLDPDEPLALMAAVDALLADQRVDAAVALANEGLEAHPDACDFLVVAAKARLRAGRDAEAADLSRKANGLCPEEAAPYYYLGTLSARAGTAKEARRLFAEYMRTGGDAKRVPVAYR